MRKTNKRKIPARFLCLAIGLSTITGLTIFSVSHANDFTAADIVGITGDARDAEQVRNDILIVLEHARSIAGEGEIPQLEFVTNQVQTMGGEELLGTFSAEVVESLSEFSVVYDTFDSIESDLKDKQTIYGISNSKTGINLRDADYTPLCGSVRANTTASVAILGTFLVAEAIKDTAISGCGTVVVAAGFGGSPQSAICSGLISAAFQIARAVWETFLLCQDSIDSAEILGTYERTEDVFNAVNEHDTDMKAAITQHDADLKSNLTTHDLEIKDDLEQHDDNISTQLSVHDTRITSQVSLHDTEVQARLTELAGQVDYAIKLLLTPEGRRPGWNRQ